MHRLGAFVTLGGLSLATASGLLACSPSASGSKEDPAGAAGAMGGIPGGGFANQGGAPPIRPASGGSSEPPPIVLHLPEAGPTDGSAEAGCARFVEKGELLPLDMLIMFDQSKSMSCPIPAGGDRWAATKTALANFVQNAGAAGINVGLSYFGVVPPGTDPLASSCDPQLYQTPDVEFIGLPDGAQYIINSLNAHGPLTDTPTLAALVGAIGHAVTWKGENTSHTVIVVLVTDGQPSSCGSASVADVVAAAARGFGVGSVATYVIGILSPNSTCDFDPNLPTQADLDSVAVAGGTNKALIIDTTQDTAAQLLATMNSIRQDTQISCEYGIPPAPENEEFDYEAVNVIFTDPAGVEHTTYYMKDGCDPAKGDGWHYDKVPTRLDPPSKIVLCDSTCTAVTATFGYQVNVKVGCKSEEPPK